MKQSLFFVLALILIIAPACSPMTETPQPTLTIVLVPTMTATATPEVIPTPEPSLTPVPELSFEKAIYQDIVNGFEFDYPSTWAIDDGEQQSRGSYIQFYSWDWQPGDIVESTPPGETILTLTVNNWDPKNDLEAFVAQRQLAWEASGIVILSEDGLTLSDDRPAIQFTVQGTDKSEGFFLFTTLGDQYLTFSGSGDLDLLAEIAHTVRFGQ